MNKKLMQILMMYGLASVMLDDEGLYGFAKNYQETITHTSTRAQKIAWLRTQVPEVIEALKSSPRRRLSDESVDDFVFRMSLKRVVNYI